MRRSGLRRWTIRIGIFLAGLIILIFITGEIVFQTDLPRNLVTSALEKQLGLKIAVKSLSTGWMGRTTLHDVAITLPLADRAFLDVPEMEIKHSALPWLILPGPISVEAISIHHPKLEVVQDPSGSWNLQEVAELLARAGGSQNSSGKADTSTGDTIPQLPRLDVTDAKLVITDNEGRSATVSGLSISGRPDGPLVWEYQAAVPNQVDIAGRVAVGGVWSHQIKLNLRDAGSWMSPWVKSWPASAHLDAMWTGQFANGQVTGRLDFDDAVFGSNKMSGPVEINIQGNGATVQPDGLLIANAGASSLGARIDGGQILLNGSDIESKALSVEFGGGRASVDGKVAISDGSANVRVAWRDVSLPASVTQSGDLSVDYTPSLGQPRFTAVLNSQGKSKSVDWDGRINVDGTGNSLETLSLAVTAPKLRFDSPGENSFVDLSGFVAQVSRTGDGLSLTDLHLGHSHPLSGSGGYSFGTRVVWLSLDARGWPIPHAGTGTLDFDFNIWADPARVHLEQLYLGSGMLSAYGDGEYVYDLPKPASAHLYFYEMPQYASAQDQSAPFRGDLRGRLDLEGTLKPVDISIGGDASGADVHFGQRPLGDLKFGVEGNLRDGQVSLLSRDIEFLGGEWYVSGQWPVNNSLLRLDTVQVKHLSLPLAFAREDVKGELDGKWSVDIRQFNPNGIFVRGSAVVSNLVIGGNAADGSDAVFAADRIELPNTHLEDGEIEIKRISMNRKMAGVSGSARGGIYTTTADPADVWVKVDASSWPVYPGSAAALCVLSGKGNVDVNLKGGSALGHLDVSADTSLASKSLGRVDAAVDFNQRQITATQIEIAAMGGSASGNAAVDLDNLFAAHAKLDWKDVDLARIAGITPNLSELTGKIKGSLEVHPATVPRPLQPLAVVLHVSSDKVRWGQIGLGDMQAFAYVGPHRVVLDDSPDRPTQIAFAGGLVQVWGRLSRHAGDLYQSLVQVNLQNLDLDAIVPRGSKVARTPGILGGQITLVGRPGAPELAFGEGHLVLSHSDLAGTGPIAILYNLMHFGHNAKKPQGFGRIDFTVQRRNIAISGMRYFDRGAEVHAGGGIADFTKLANSPIDFTIVGSARPLKSISLPGVSDIDDVLDAIQRGAVTVHVGGTFNHPETHQVLFSDLGQEMQNILIGIGQPGNASE
ncbi:MAG TPA: hypothetical protein VGG44_06045 [Tepidisphaeraceae bacterium]